MHGWLGLGLTLNLSDFFSKRQASLTYSTYEAQTLAYHPADTLKHKQELHRKIKPKVKPPGLTTHSQTISIQKCKYTWFTAGGIRAYVSRSISSATGKFDTPILCPERRNVV